MVVSVICGVKCFNAIVSTSPATAIEGSTEQTLYCKYTIYNKHADVSSIRVNWYKGKSVWDEQQIWRVYSVKQNANLETNEALHPYARQLTGLTSRFPDILSQHAIMFTRLSLDDAGSYSCFVTYFISSNSLSSESPHYRLHVYGKYAKSYHISSYSFCFNLLLGISMIQQRMLSIGVNVRLCFQFLLIRSCTT